MSLEIVDGPLTLSSAEIKEPPDFQPFWLVMLVGSIL
jgi:hypothetical protein